MGTANELPCITPTVKISDDVRADVAVTRVSEARGGTPGKAYLRVVGDGDDVSPVALTQPAAGDLLHGMRVEVYSGDYRYHHGFLMVRRDQGAADTVLWESHDDRILLQGIPVRGALVCDVDGSCKYLPRYEPRTNPGGAWNCTFVSCNLTGNGDELIPVFAPRAQRTTDYESPTEAYPEDPAAADGKVYPWTPRRFMKYLWALSALNPNVGAGGVTGINTTHWRGIYGGQLISWASSTVGDMDGLPIGSEDTDPLDRKMPDIQYQGQTLLGAIMRTLKAAGTHDLVCRPQADGTSAIDFCQIGYPAVSGYWASVDLRLQRGGSVTNPNTIYDFSVTEDASELFDAVLVEGDVVRAETRVIHEWDDPVDCSLARAWTEDEQDAFLACVNGGAATDGSGTFARYPTIAGDDTYSGSWSEADGKSGRPLAFARTPEAMALAREHFPRVFRAFRLNSTASEVSAALAGASSQFSSTSTYARLEAQRPALAEQLQFMLRDLSGGGSVENSLLANMPIRVEIYREEDEKWIEVPREISLRVSGDGTIFLDGLAEAENGGDYCLYKGDLEDYTRVMDTRMRKFRLNLAFPMDHRVFGYKETSTSVLDEDYTDAIHGRPLLYIDSPESYHEHHQVASYPAAAPQYYAGGSGTSAPLSRLLPPGSERASAEYAATRRLASAQRLKRTSSWEMVGIRAAVRAGDWLGRIQLDPGTGGASTYYDVGGSIEAVEWDFLGQRTSIGPGMAEIV